MNYIAQIRENISCPQFGDNHYGKWSCLRVEQRRAYYYLITLLNSSDSVIKSKYREIKRLNKEIERLNENNQAMQEEMAKTWKIVDDYKSRIDKAIKHLEDEQKGLEDWNFDGYDPRLDKIINILNGGDENDN